MEITFITSNIKPYESGIVQSSQHRKGRRKKNELFYSSVIKKYLIKEGKKNRIHRQSLIAVLYLLDLTLFKIVRLILHIVV